MRQHPPVKADQRPIKPEQRTAKPEQRPVKPEQRPIKPEQRPVKPEQRPVKPEQRPVKPEQRPIKPEQRQVKPEQRPVKPEQRPVKEEHSPERSEQRPIRPTEGVKRQEVAKSSLPSDKTSNEGYCELNTLMSKQLDAELDDLMAKVWEVIPKSPSSDVEGLFAAELKNNIGNDLRNVIGLNLTQRLLNVFNPLHVKVTFNGKPEREELRQFLRKYNFLAFTRQSVNIFEAQVKTIDDFDNICFNDVRCGDVKVSVEPIYEFHECPRKIKTKYSHPSITKNTYVEETNKNTTKTEPPKENIKKEEQKEKTVTNTNNKTIQESPVKKPQTAAEVLKNVSQSSEASKIAIPEKKINTPAKTVNTVQKATPKKPSKQEDDFDELDDHDILALMSEGIILDECSGSDDE
ncbi:uncharacterized protein LOC142984082 [Anticarsia gemmatalis]|uniref:uncharacterized protein LOC142984082 n=1 Tax=Anticarsia gemmatalis TaxID=129554 RepID=UPI003F769354